jgi:hypothetical protein
LSIDRRGRSKAAACFLSFKKIFIYLFILEIKSHYVTQAGLKLEIYLSLLNAGIIGMHHHIGLKASILEFSSETSVGHIYSHVG